jgi:proton-dependent oligopeptide transporter, POT family
MSVTRVPPLASRGLPKGIYLLCGVEMWERFSYYGMRAFLVLFLISHDGGWGWSKERAATLYGFYTGLVYLSSLLGGYLADRFLGTHGAVLLGSMLVAAGHFCLAVPSPIAFLLGLSLVILGTGCHKPNVSTMVGQLFHEGDHRRDSAFTVFFMGINIGALLGPLVCGSLAEDPRFGWHWGFASAGVGMVLGTALYVLFRRPYLGGIGRSPPHREAAASEAPRYGEPRREAVPLGRARAARSPLTREERDRIVAIVILALFQALFFVAFEQAGSSLTFFAKERTDRAFLGGEIKTSYFQSINSFAIVVFSPVFAALWMKLAARGREPTTPIKFVGGLALMASSFAVMVVAAWISDRGVLVSPVWLLATYVLQTCAELCVSPVGLSLVSQLAPPRFASRLMGFWFVSLAVGNLSAGLLAGRVEKIERGEVFRLLGGQADFFLIVFFVAATAAVALFLLARRIDGLTHGRA